MTFLINLAYKLGQLSVTDQAKIPGLFFDEVLDHVMFPMIQQRALPSTSLRSIIRKEFKRIQAEVVPFKLEQQTSFTGIEGELITSDRARCYMVMVLDESSYLMMAKARPESRVQPVVLSWSVTPENTEVETDALFARRVSFAVNTIGRAGIEKLGQNHSWVVHDFLMTLIDNMAEYIRQQNEQVNVILRVGEQLGGIAQCLSPLSFSEQEAKKSAGKS